MGRRRWGGGGGGDELEQLREEGCWGERLGNLLLMFAGGRGRERVRREREKESQSRKKRTGGMEGEASGRE
jgi:hypothetical protein